MRKGQIQILEKAKNNNFSDELIDFLKNENISLFLLNKVLMKMANIVFFKFKKGMTGAVLKNYCYILIIC